MRYKQKCNNELCEKKHTCSRYFSAPDPYWEEYGKFSFPCEYNIDEEKLTKKAEKLIEGKNDLTSDVIIPLLIELEDLRKLIREVYVEYHHNSGTLKAGTLLDLEKIVKENVDDNFGDYINLD